MFSSRATGWSGLALEVYRVHGHISQSDASYQQPTIVLPLQDTGEAAYRSNGVLRRHVFHPSQVGIFAPGFVHSCHPTAGHEFAELQITPTFLMKKAQEFDLGTGSWGVEVRSAMAIDDAPLEHLCRALIAELQAGAPSGRLYADHLISLVAYRLLQGYAEIPTAAQRSGGNWGAQRIKRALELIHERPGQELSLDELAAAACMSVFHFAREFKRCTGITPHQYVMRYRIEQAKHLLRTTDLSIAAIGEKTGFNTASHFSTAFRQIEKMSPRRFRSGL